MVNYVFIKMYSSLWYYSMFDCHLICIIISDFIFLHSVLFYGSKMQKLIYIRNKKCLDQPFCLHSLNRAYHIWALLLEPHSVKLTLNSYEPQMLRQTCASALSNLSLLLFICIIYGPCYLSHKVRNWHFTHRNGKGSDQPVLPHILIRAFCCSYASCVDLEKSISTKSRL